VEATVTRVVRLGFEVRVEAATNGDDSAGTDVWAQVSRGTADGLGLTPGDTVYLTPQPA
jgi:sulfate transport system ATP-binding protein